MEKEESVNERRESGDGGDMDKQNSETEKPVESELTVEKGENGSELISSAPPIEESEGEAVSINGDDDKEPAAEDSDATVKQEQKLAKIPTRKMSTSSNKSTRSDNGAKNGDTSKVNGTKDKTMSTEEKKVPVSANQSQQLVSTLTSRNSSTPMPSSSTRSTRSQNPEFLARQRNFLHKIHLASNHLIVDDDLLMDDDDNSLKTNNKSSGNVGTAQTDENNSVDGLPAKRKRERSASNGTLSPRIPSPSVTNMLGGSASANNSGSSSPAASQMQPATKKRRSTRTDSTGSQQMSASPMTEATADRFCWVCHKDGTGIKCETCPRVFHLRCIQLENAPTEDWVCPECMTILHAENVDTRSRAMQLLSLDQLCNLLKYAVSRMKMYSGAEPFWKAVDVMEFPQYREYVAYPMDLSLLERNIKKRLYGSTEAFVADTKWMLHNCVIFNSFQSRLTAIAKMLVKICRQEMAEIENCPDCYLNAHIRKDSWFIEVCRRPHVLVWAKLKGFPFWPAKVMRTNRESMVDVRFFGAHDRAWVPVRECFLYSKAIPASARNKKRNNLEACIQEVEQHTKKLREKYGTFQHAPFRTNFEPGREPEQLRMLLPYYNPDDDGGPPSTKRNKMYGVSYSFRTYQRSNHAEKEEKNKNDWRSRTSENDESMEGFKFTDSKSKSEKKKVWESENLEDDNFKRTSRSRKRTISGSRVSRPNSVSSSDDSEASDLALQQDKKNDSAKSASLIEWSKFEESAAQLTVEVEGIVSDEDKLSVTSDDRKLRDGEDSRDIVLPTASTKLTEGEIEDKTAIETTPKSSEVVKKAFTGLSIVDKLQEKLLRLERSNVSHDAVSCANARDDDKPKKTEEGSRNSEDCSTQKSSIGSSNDKEIVIERTSNSKRLQDSITDDECRNEERERSESPVVNRGPLRSEPKCYGKQLLPKVVLYNVAFSKNMVFQKGLNSNEQTCSNEKFGTEAAEKEIMEERVCKSSLMSETTSRLENLLKNRFEETECHMTDSSGESESSSCPDNDIKLTEIETEKDNEDDKDTETKSTSSESTSDSGEGSVEMDALKRTPEHGYSRSDYKETILGQNGKCDVPNKIASKSSEEMQMEEEKEANVNDTCMESAKDCSKELEESNKNAPDDCNKTDVVSEPQSKEVTADESPPDKEVECDAEKNGFLSKHLIEPSHESDQQSLILVPTETEPISEPNRQNSDPISELETHSSNPVSELGKQSSEFVSESGGESSVSVSESEKESSDPVLESENQNSDPVPEPEKIKFENVSEFEKQSSELPEKNAKKCAILDCESVVTLATGDYEEANKEAERKSDKDTSEESNQHIEEKNDKTINEEHSKKDNKSTEKSIKEENTLQDSNENLRKDVDKCDKGSTDTSVKNSAVKVYLAKTSKLLDKKIRELSEMSRTEAQLGNGVTITPADPFNIPSKKTKTTDDSVGKEIENTINPIRKIKEEPIDPDDVPTESSASSEMPSSTSSAQSSAKSSPEGKQNASVAVKKGVDVENSLKKEKVFNKKLLMDDKDRLTNNDSPASLSEKDGIFPSLFLDPSITITVINDKQGETVDVPTTNKRKICGSDINVNELRASVNLSKDISLTVVGAAYNGPAKDQPTSLDMECDHESDHEETQNSASSATSSSAVPLTVPNTMTGQNGNKQKKQKPAGGSETLQARSRARKSFPNRPILPNVKIKPHPELVNGIGTFNSKTSLMRRNSSGTNSNSSDSRRSSFGASPHELLMPGPQSGGETHGENSGTSDNNNNNNHGSAMVVLPPILGNPPTSTTNHIQALRAVNGNIGAPDIRMMPGPHGQPHPGGSNSRISPAGQGPTSSGSSCMPPQLKPRPQGPLLSQHPPSLPAEAGPVSAEINRHKHKLCDFLSSTLEEMLRDLSSVGNAEATIKSLQLELEKLQWRHNQELAEMKHNTDLVVMEMRASMESDRQRAVAETIRQCEIDKQRAVEETKKKQWCTNCGKEALFYCCWNTSYCDYPCQQRHWPQHMSSCAQNSQSNEGGGREGADGVQRKSPQTSANSAAHHKSNPSQQQQQQQQQQHQHQQNVAESACPNVLASAGKASVDNQGVHTLESALVHAQAFRSVVNPWFDSVPMFNPTTSASMIYRGAYASKTESPSPSVTEDDFDTNNNNYEGSQRDGSQEVDRKDIKLGDLIRMGVEIPKIQRKRKRCGKCAGCTTVGNCGQCPPCNSTRTHQVCRQRRCTNLQMETIVATTAKKIRINTQQKLQQMVSNGPSGGKPMGGPPPGYNPPVMSQQARGMGGPMGRVPPQYSGLVPVPRPGNVQVSGYTSSQTSTTTSACLTTPTAGNFAFLSPFTIPVSFAGSVDTGGGTSSQDCRSLSLNQVPNEVQGETGPNNADLPSLQVPLYENTPITENTDTVQSAVSDESSMPLLVNVVEISGVPGGSDTIPNVLSAISSDSQVENLNAVSGFPTVCPMVQNMNTVPAIPALSNTVPIVQDLNAVHWYVDQQSMLPNVLYQST